MKPPVDPRSAMLGLLAGALLTAAVAASSSPAGTVGRFQVSGTGNHGLVIDTVTGQVWTGYFPNGSGKTDGDFYSPKLPAKP